MRLRGPVLVGTDFSPSSNAALREGRQLAEDLDTELLVCHVLPELMRIRMLFPQWGGIDAEFQETIGTKAAEAFDQQLEAVFGRERRGVTMLVDSGSPAAGLLSQADATNAGIIVTGPGKVADRVVRHAAVPVLVARSSPHGPVIGATDFSAASLPALETAAAEARRRRTTLHLLHVVDVGTYALAGAAAAGMVYPSASATELATFDRLRVEAEARLREEFNQFGVGGSVHAVCGPTVDSIVSRAETTGAELVVVGTHGRTGFARLTLGSTAEQVVERAPCSVLVVRLVHLKRAPFI
jgi:nucleotide-binding universal stress UspA family protein